MIVLNRLDISGDIDTNTPKCVFEEICKVSSIKFENYDDLKYRNRLINKIYSYPGEKISDNYEKNITDLRIIARFVNPDQPKWKKEVLIKAFRFLMSFQNDELSKQERPSFDVGLQTSFSPHSLNACVLYRICRLHSLKVNFNSDIYQMASLIKLRFQDHYLVLNTLKLSIYDALRFTCNTTDLVNILYAIDPEIPADLVPRVKNPEQEIFINNISYEEYSDLADLILTNNSKKPDTHPEAIVMAAIYHKIDISKCKNPIREYNLIERTPYFPYDNNLKNRLANSHLHSESLQNPYLNVVFNPNFPENMYSEEDLVKMCQEEGLTDDDNSYYTNLQLAYLTESFVHSKQGLIVNSETTFLDEISELSMDEVIVYGVRCESRQSFRAFTYTELYDTFSHYKRFINPSNNEIFSDENIQKLYLLCQKKKRLYESEENYENRLELGDEIERIRIYTKSNNQYMNDFLFKYQECQEEDKRKVENILLCLLHSAMYMRNWDGVSDFPLTSEQTNYEYEKQIVIDDRVTQSLIKFENACRKVDYLNNLGQFILNMPLMEYMPESHRFLTVNDESEGLTIQDRIRIVRGGEDEHGISSCIRLSSNKFCATAYYYMILIGFRLPFNISEVSHIF